MTLPKKVLLAVTGESGPFYEDGSKSGLFYSEGLHPYEYFTKNGYEVVVASENGKYGLDEHSVTDKFLNAEELALYKDANSPFNKALSNVKKASTVNPKEFGIFFAAGGHATDIDFVGAKDLQHVASEIYANGGVVSAVCHGPLVLVGVKDTNGECAIKGKKVTGFTTRGEADMGMEAYLRKKGLPFVTEALKDAGAIVEEPSGPWDDFTVVDGRIVTGPNPASATSTAQKAVEVFTQSN